MIDNTRLVSEFGVQYRPYRDRVLQIINDIRPAGRAAHCLRLNVARFQVAAAMLLSAAAAHAQPSINWSKAETFNLLMVEDQFVPDHLSFRHGVPYRLHLENRGKDLHEFTAPEFLADALVRDPGALANAGQEVVVQPGQVVDVYLVPMRAGSVPADLCRSRLGRDGGRDRRGVTGLFAITRSGVRRPRRGRRVFQTRRRTARDSEAEHRAAAGAALGSDFPTMRLDNGTADRQSYAHPIGLRRHEWLEQPCLHQLRQSGSGIGHADLDHATCACRGNRQFALRRAVHRLRGVAHEVQQNLLDLHLVDDRLLSIVVHPYV